MIPVLDQRFEIEISSFCNRQCPWCSNKFFPRTGRDIMEENLFIKIISELEHLGYNSKNTKVTFSKFNEPTADMDLLRLRVAQLRIYLPDVFLNINTNGDYLYGSDIAALPMDKISIMDYDCKGMEYGYELLESIGAEIIEKDRHMLIANIDGTAIRFVSDWTKHCLIEDRGHLLDKVPVRYKHDKELRMKPCFMINRPVSIDYKGNLSPCCHIREEADIHKDFIMGNLNKDSLKDILEGDKFRNFNNVMEGEDYTMYFYPCQYCQKEL